MLYSGASEAAELAGVGLAEVGEDLRVAARRLDLLVDVAHPPQRTVLGQHLAREGDGALAQLTFLHQLVDHAHLLAFTGRHVHAGGHHLQRLLRSNQPRQPLRAAGARQQAEIDFRQSAAGGRHGHAIITAQRGLQPAAEGGAVDSGDGRLRRALEVAHGVDRPLLAPRSQATDVGAGDEGAPLADQHDRLGPGVGHGRLHPQRDAFQNASRQRVHRRRIEGDDADVAFECVVGHGVDGGHGGFLSVDLVGVLLRGLFVAAQWPLRDDLVNPGAPATLPGRLILRGSRRPAE